MMRKPWHCTRLAAPGAYVSGNRSGAQICEFGGRWLMIYNNGVHRLLAEKEVIPEVLEKLDVD
jgi:hypothetical protein